jgi:hypothetical protein
MEPEPPSTTTSEPSVIEDRVDKEEIEQFLLAMEDYIPTVCEHPA